MQYYTIIFLTSVRGEKIIGILKSTGESIFYQFVTYFNSKLNLVITNDPHIDKTDKLYIFTFYINYYITHYYINKGMRKYYIDILQMYTTLVCRVTWPKSRTEKCV